MFDCNESAYFIIDNLMFEVNIMANLRLSGFKSHLHDLRCLVGRHLSCPNGLAKVTQGRREGGMGRLSQAPNLRRILKCRPLNAT